MQRISSLFLALCLAGSFGLIGCSGELAPEIDRADLNDRCDYALSTILNSDELLGCEVAFEVCADWELQNLVRQFECDTGEVTEGCSETGRPDVDQTCYAQFTMIQPPENSAEYTDNGLVALHGTNWCGPGDEATDTIPPAHCNDAACRRHDHCDNGGVTGHTSSTLLCGCDKRIYDSTSDAVDRSSNAAINAVFWGYTPWPCLGYDNVCTKREWGWHGTWAYHYACVQYRWQWTHRYWNKYSGGTDEGYLWDPKGISATSKGTDQTHCAQQ
jgi:hypothetical protein